MEGPVLVGLLLRERAGPPHVDLAVVAVQLVLVDEPLVLES